MSAASAARRVDPALEILALEATGYAAYGLCGIPYYLAGQVKHAEDLLAYPPEFFRKRRGIDLRLHAQAQELDPDRRLLHYSQNGTTTTVSYDQVVIAAGGSPRLPSLPGLRDERVFTARTLEDAKALRGLLDAGRIGHALVVGGSYIGLEMAEAFTTRGVDVTVVEMLPQIMPSLDEPIASLVEHEVRSHGVDLRLGARLEAIRRTQRGLEAVIDGESILIDVAVIAVGVRAASGIAGTAGASEGPGGALLVDEQMRTSLPHVYAAGDCIAPFHRVLGRPAFVPLGPAANKTGRVAGTVAAGGNASFSGIVGTAVAKIYNLAAGRTGLTLAEAQVEGLCAVATDVVGKSRAAYYPGSEPLTMRLVHEQGGRLLGAQMVGRDGVAKRVDVVATALHAGMHVDDLLGLDLSYAPPYAPVYEPVLLAAQAASRSVERLPILVP
jgi:NADPH-dependent 2,4-dienoyl-CoA reductase/sulfur reductase-like enzyme